MDLSVLEEIGLTKAETTVFCTLLSIGSTKAGPIVAKSKLQNAVVHRALHSLIEKGLATYAMIGKTREYQAVSPKHLLEYVEERKHRLQQLLPELEAARLLATKQPEATIFRGIKGVREVWSILLQDSKELISFGASKTSHLMLGDAFWKGHHTRRKERGIKSRHLIHHSLNSRAKEMVKEKDVQVRYTQTEFDGLTETAIANDKVAIILYVRPPFAFLIEHEQAAKSYRAFFENLWCLHK